ncbi:MAG: class I SAM-dependent methyltransferase [Actinomycetota bacterium]
MSDAGTPPLDRERSEAFLQTMLGITNGGALALMCSIGHRTGLFDALAGAGPLTSAALAERAELDERYVREWLSAMAAGGIVDYEPDGATFHLPPEHAGLVTRQAGSLNMTTYCQYVALLASVEDDIVDAFHNGGGVPYDRYPTFQSLMAESSFQRLRDSLLPEVVPLLPDGPERLTAGIDVADVGCGSGRALNILAGAFPASRFTGFDIAVDGLDRGRAEAAEAGNTNVVFTQRDAADLAEHERFDLITSFDAVHDQAHPRQMVAGIFAALRPGGTYLCVEPKASSHLHENLELPGAPFMYTISTMHCMTVSLAYGGDGLGTAWGEQMATEMLTEAGFVDIRVTGNPADRSNHYLIATRPA